MERYSKENKKIEDKTILRLAELLYYLDGILAAAIYESGTKDYDFLMSEIQRANDYNCPVVAYFNKSRIMNLLEAAKSINEDRGLLVSRLEEVKRLYPEMLQAATETLKRRAWNEWK